MNDPYKEKLLSAAKSIGWSYYCDGDGVDFSKYSPAGEDFGFYVHAVTGDEILNEVIGYVNAFDAEEHMMMWIEAKLCGSTRGIPDIRTLVKDADAIDGMLYELMEVLEAVCKDEEE